MGHQAVAHPVERLQVDLLRRPHLHEAHGWPRYGLRDRLGVDQVVLVALHVRLHELRRHDAHRMAHRLKLARQPLRARARFHADDRRLGAFEELQQRVAPEGGALDRRAGRVEAEDVE